MIFRRYERKLKGQSRKGNLETQVALGTRHRTRTKNTKQKTKKRWAIRTRAWTQYSRRESSPRRV